MKSSRPLLALLSASLLSQGIRAEEDQEHTTVPVFLPYYESKSWSMVRGSIVTSDADETTYTIFCPQTPPSCDLAMEFPFVFAENDSTLRFEGTRTSTFTANLECELGGTTAATCSGYSSLGDGLTIGSNTGPTEVSWSSTLSGSEVEWGVLTLGDKPSSGSASATAVPVDDSVVSGDFIYDGTLPTSTDGLPAETDTSAGSRPSTSWVLFGSAATFLMLGVLV